MNQIPRQKDVDRVADAPSAVPPSFVPAPTPESPQISRPTPVPPRASRLVLLGLGLAVVGLAVVVGARYFLPREVELVAVAPGPFQAELSGPGTLDALSKANIGTSLQGVITRLAVERNDCVARGDLVAEIAADDLRANLASAQASREAARQSAEAAASDVTRMEAAAENARSTYARQTTLLPEGTTSRSSFESAEMAARQGEADLAKARSALLAAKAQEAAADAAVAASEAQLEKSVVRAPIDGVVVARNLNLGDVASPNSAIVTIADPESIVLSTRFDESTIADIEPGLGARIRFGGNGAPVYPGTVVRVGREVDQETREFTVDIALAHLPPNWALGQRGTAFIEFAKSDEVMSVPVASIARRDGMPGVWMAEDGRAVWQPVDLGRIGGARVEVLAGLKAGDRVIAVPDGVYRWMPVKGGRDAS